MAGASECTEGPGSASEMSVDEHSPPGTASGPFSAQTSKVYYHKDEEPTPYMTEVHVPPDLITLGDLKHVLPHSNFKFYAMTHDNEIGTDVKYELRDDMQALPRSANGRFELYLQTSEGSSHNGSDGGSCIGGSRMSHRMVPGPAPGYHAQKYVYSTESESTFSGIPANYMKAPLGQRYHNPQYYPTICSIRRSEPLDFEALRLQKHASESALSTSSTALSSTAAGACTGAKRLLPTKNRRPPEILPPPPTAAAPANASSASSAARRLHRGRSSQQVTPVDEPTTSITLPLPKLLPRSVPKKLSIGEEEVVLRPLSPIRGSSPTPSIVIRRATPEAVRQRQPTTILKKLGVPINVDAPPKKAASANKENLVPPPISIPSIVEPVAEKEKEPDPEELLYLSKILRKSCSEKRRRSMQGPRPLSRTMTQVEANLLPPLYEDEGGSGERLSTAGTVGAAPSARPAGSRRYTGSHTTACSGGRRDEAPDASPRRHLIGFLHRTSHLSLTSELSADASFYLIGHRGRKFDPESTIGSESDARVFSDEDDRGSTTTDFTSVSRQAENMRRRRKQRGNYRRPSRMDEPVRPIDTQAWIRHTNAMRGMPSIVEGSEGAPTPLPGEFSAAPMRPGSSSTVTSGSQHGQGGPPSGPPGTHTLRLDFNGDKKRVVEAMAMPNSGLDIKNRTWLKIPIPNSFLGSELVDWLLEHVDGLRERKDARRYAMDLLKAKLIAHVVNKCTFTEQCYYVLGEEAAATTDPATAWQWTAGQSLVPPGGPGVPGHLVPQANSMISGYASMPVSPFPVLPRTSAAAGPDLHSQASGGSGSNGSGSDHRRNRPVVLPPAPARLDEMSAEMAASRQSFRLAMNQPCEFFVDNI